MEQLQVETLARTAARKIPLGQIIGSGILKVELDPAVSSILRSRINFEEFYRAGLLDMAAEASFDKDILHQLVNKLPLPLLWHYIDPIFFDPREEDDEGNLSIIDDFPSSPEGIKMITRRIGGSKRDAVDRVNRAYRKIVKDVIRLLDRPGWYFVAGQRHFDSEEDFGEFERSSRRDRLGIIWDGTTNKDSTIYRLLIHRFVKGGRGDYVGDHPDLDVKYYDTIDEILIAIITAMLEIKTFETFSFPLGSSDKLKPNQVAALTALRVGLDQTQVDTIVNRVWKDRQVIRLNRIEFSIKELADTRSKMVAVGKYLYFFLPMRVPLFFTMDEGNLLLTSLLYNEDPIMEDIELEDDSLYLDSLAV
jgi:hypothetical protein